MPGTTPTVLLHAVNLTLLAALPDARAIQDDGPRKHRLALGLMAAEQESAKGTEAGCVAAIAALAGVQDEAQALDHARNAKVQRSAKAAEGALRALRAIDWPDVPPAPVLTVQGFATVSPGGTAVATLVLSAPAPTDVTATATITGLAPADLADGRPSFPAKVPAGAVTAPLPVAFAAQALTADKPASLAISAPSGATPGTPAAFSFVLAANTVVQPPPTVSLTGPGDMTPSTTAEVSAAATVALSTPADHVVTASYALAGQQDGDLLSPATGPVVVPTGQISVTIPIRVAPLTLAADRALTLALSDLAGAAEPYPAPVGFALKANAVVTTLPVLTVAPPAAVQISQTQPVEVHAPATLSAPAPAGGSSVDFLGGGVPAQMFVGDTFPVGTVTVPEGETKHPDAVVKFQLKPQVDTKWRRAQVSVALSNAVRATLAGDSVGVDVIGTGDGGRGIDTGNLAWLAGTCLPPNDISLLKTLDAQSAWVGSPLKLYKLKSHGTADDAALLSSLQQKGPIIAGLTQRKVATAITVDFITHQYPAGYVVQAAQGALDNFWDTISRVVATWDVYGPELWIVAGHEVGSTYAHGADSDPDQQNYSHYKETMVRFRKAMQSRNPKVRIDQSFIRRPRSINIARAFAGPDGCDGVGHDPYGNPPGGIKSASDWAKFADGVDANGPIGPRSMLKFAKSVGKLVTFAEWGPVEDDPAYVQGMYDLFSGNAADIGYESQFCINDGGANKDHRLSPDSTNPQASALYRRLWGGRPAAKAAGLSPARSRGRPRSTTRGTKHG